MCCYKIEYKFLLISLDSDVIDIALDMFKFLTENIGERLEMANTSSSCENESRILVPDKGLREVTKFMKQEFWSGFRLIQIN